MQGDNSSMLSSMGCNFIRKNKEEIIIDCWVLPSEKMKREKKSTNKNEARIKSLNLEKKMTF